MIEAYRLVLTHYMVDKTTGEHIKLDDPLCIEHVYDREYCGSPILLNRMFDELKTYALARVERSEDAANPYKLEKSEKWPYVLERREDGRT